jgi:hypothetical protein
MTTSTSGATGLGRRFFEETPYGLSVEGHIENTARHNTSFDNQGWLNAKTNVGLPCPGKPRPTWPPHWIYPMPRSNETELVRYQGTECRTSPFVPQISPDFVPPNERFRVSSDMDVLPSESETQPSQQSPEPLMTHSSMPMESPKYQDWNNVAPKDEPMDNIEKTGNDKMNLSLIIVSGLILFLLVIGTMMASSVRIRNF